MPSFPDAVWAPTTKSNGDTIQPAHINDAQTEIVAIEGGYRNGTAPLNSSNSTLVALSVTGGSTLAGTLTAGASTLASLSVSGASTLAQRPTMPPPDAVRLALNASLAVVHNTTLAVSWSTAQFVTNSSIHSTTTNPERMTPQSTGVYRVEVTLVGNNNMGSTAFLEVVIEDSSAGILGIGRAPLNTATGPFGPTASASALKHFESVTGSTQWVRVIARHVDAASTQALDSTRTFCHFYKL